jgi:hypothetical protein
MLTKAEVAVELLEQFEDDAGAECMQPLDLPLPAEAHNFLRFGGRKCINAVFQAASVFPRPPGSQLRAARQLPHLRRLRAGDVPAGNPVVNFAFQPANSIIGQLAPSRELTFAFQAPAGRTAEPGDVVYRRLANNSIGLQFSPRLRAAGDALTVTSPFHEALSKKAYCFSSRFPGFSKSGKQEI